MPLIVVTSPLSPYAIDADRQITTEPSAVNIDKPNTPDAAENHPLYILRDNLAKADAFITAAEDLNRQPRAS